MTSSRLHPPGVNHLATSMAEVKGLGEVDRRVMAVTDQEMGESAGKTTPSVAIEPVQ